MHEDDGDSVDAVGLGLFDRRLDIGDVEKPFHAAVSAHPLVHLDDALVELFGQDDLLGEDVGARLIGDAQRIAKTLGDEQQDAVALALQQRVGGDRGAHAHLADGIGRNGRAGREAEQGANAMDGGVGVGLRVFRQQLHGMERTVRSAPDDVGEGTAAVDPEVPFSVHRPSSRCHCPPC